jgi:UDPglucose--hexose-1-phosphate uridylyltransferase
VAREAAAFARASACPLCDLADEPSIEETEHFRWIAPRGASFGYQQWIVPREHANEVGEAHELAQLLQRSARAMRSLSDSYNSIFMNFPGQPRAHWYVEIVPRTAMIAGFEIGSATAINTVEAAAAAELLRKAR